jgi:putative ABC transport system ATP-binding protein
MIQIQDLSYRYPEGDFRLVLPELTLAHGEAVALIGPSGSGKTTLLRLLSGILLPQVGRIQVGDDEVQALSESRRRALRVARIGLVFQEFELVEYLSILDNVLLPYRLHASLRLADADRLRATGLLDDLGLGDKKARKPAHLSQGERQRVAIARALVTGASLILADEPTGNLDPRTKGQVVEMLREKAGESGATLLMVTHDHALLDRFGRVLEFGEEHGAATLIARGEGH